MKKTLSSCLVAASMVLAAGSASAALFISDFSGLANNADLDGYSGWSVSELPDGGGANGFLGYGAVVDGQAGFQLGVYNDIPAGGATTFNANHGVGLSLTSPTAYPTTVETTFFIVDSTAPFLDRNDYSLGIYDGGTLLFSINFEAASQLNPDGANSLWNVSWSSGASTTPTDLGVVEGGPYDFSASFYYDDGTDIYFSASLTGLNTEDFGGVLAGFGGGTRTITDFRVTTEVGSGADWGSGVIGITGITVVPEPSTALFLGLSSLAMLRRRRS